MIINRIYENREAKAHYQAVKIQPQWVVTPGKQTNKYILFIIITGRILVLFIYITRLASNEIFSPSNKIHRDVGQAKDLSAPR